MFARFLVLCLQTQFDKDFGKDKPIEVDAVSRESPWFTSNLPRDVVRAMVLEIMNTGKHGEFIVRDKASMTGECAHAEYPFSLSLSLSCSDSFSASLSVTLSTGFDSIKIDYGHNDIYIYIYRSVCPVG